MADVIDRGQLILVTALAIAVTLVALVLLLNTVIYAENLATRGADVGGQDAIEYRGAVVRGVGGAIDAENRQDYAEQDHVRQNVTAAIDRLDTLLANQHLRRTELVETSNVSLTDGTILRHPEDTGSFENESGSASWTLASGVDATRGFAFRINDSTLTADTASAFRVVVDNGTDQWIVSVYENGGEITVAVENESAPLTDICSTSDAEPRLDLTAGTLAGDPCPGLRFGEDVDEPYDIRFVNASRAGGTYNLTIRGAPDATVQANFNDSDSGTAPYYAYAVYSASVDVRFQTNTLMFTDEVRVAPGESS